MQLTSAPLLARRVVIRIRTARGVLPLVTRRLRTHCAVFTHLRLRPFLWAQSSQSTVVSSRALSRTVDRVDVGVLWRMERVGNAAMIVGSKRFHSPQNPAEFGRGQVTWLDTRDSEVNEMEIRGYPLGQKSSRSLVGIVIQLQILSAIGLPISICKHIRAWLETNNPSLDMISIVLRDVCFPYEHRLYLFCRGLAVVRSYVLIKRRKIPSISCRSHV